MFKKVAPNASVIPAPPTKSGRKVYHPGKIDIWMLGVATVLGGQYFGWNIALIAGVYSFTIATVIVSLAYIAFVLSVSEATGALPFAGGAYGLARCTLGFFPAFLVGCFQTLQYILGVSIAVVLLVPMIISMAPSLQDYGLLIMATCYLVTLLVQIRGGRIFWGIVWVFGVFGIGAILLYAIGNLPSVDFQANAVPYPMFKYIGGVRGFFDGMPFTTMFYVGIEALNLASNDVLQPKTTIPHAQLACMGAMLLTSLFVGFIAISLPMPGGLFSIMGTLAPLNNGFIRVLGVSDAGATWITLAPTYGVAFGFMWAYARLIKSMAASKLLPPYLAKTNRWGTPWLAHLVGSSLGFGACLAMSFEPLAIYYIFPLTMAFSFLSYAGQCLAYIQLRLYFPVMKQSATKSPLGIAGAVFSLVVWIVCLVGVMLNGKVLMVVAPITALLSGYYWLVARKRQTFSAEENKILLTAHVSRFNATKHKHKPRGKGKVSAERKSAPNENSVPSQRNSVDRRSARGSNSVDRRSARGSNGVTGNNYSVIPEHQMLDAALAKAGPPVGLSAALTASPTLS